MDVSKKTVGTAGLWYLLMAVSAPAGLLIVPSMIIVAGNPAATVHNMVLNDFIFRAGIIK